MKTRIINSDCVHYLRNADRESTQLDFTFLDPPFNQGKSYRNHDDCMSDDDYWVWMKEICQLVNDLSSPGAAIYFMQREKNTEHVLRILRESGWTFQNLIIWRKKTSAIPSTMRYSKGFQIIAYATNGKRPRVFNRLRIDPPLLNGYAPRENGIFVPDVWDDIRELTSGYFAGDEAIRDKNGDRVHNQQSPIALLLRMILSSTLPDDCVFDPFCGTGTTLAVASQLGRSCIGIENDPVNVKCINNRLMEARQSDSVASQRQHYSLTPSLDEIWPINVCVDDEPIMAAM